MASKNKPGCNCCVVPIDCNACEPNVASVTYKVVIAGIIDDTCTNCSNLNGTYILTNVTDCGYEFLSSTPATCSGGSGGPLISLEFLPSLDTQIIVIISYGNVSQTRTIEYNSGEIPEPNCLTFVDEDIPFLSSVSTLDKCDATSSTCKLTSL